MKKLSIGLLGMLSLVAVFAIPSVASAAFYSASTNDYLCGTGIGNQAWNSPFINSSYNYAVGQGASASNLSTFDSAIDSFFAGPYGIVGNERSSPGSAGSISWSFYSMQGNTTDQVHCYGSITVTVSAPVYSCTGTTPPNATLCSGDDTNLTIDTAKTLKSSCTTTKCEYTCNSGYTLSGGTCVLNPTTYTLTVNSSGASNVAITSSTAPGTTNYSVSGLSGTSSHTLTAPTLSGYTFSSWTGCSSTSGNSCTRSMSSANRTVTANYTAIVGTYTLTVNSTGASNVAITSSTAPGTTNYNVSGLSGTSSHTLTAPTLSGYTFSSWTGCSSTSGNSCTRSMSSASRTVTANYTSSGGGGSSFTLTVNSSGASNVAITSSTAPGTTNYSVSGLSGTSSHTLTAPTLSGYTFSSWTGCSSTSGNSCTRSMSSASRTVTANYTSSGGGGSSFTLTTAVSPTGSGTISGSGISCPGDCSQSYTSGTSVTLTASPSVGYAFLSWSGACSGQGSSCTISMSVNKSTTANFTTAPTYTLTVNSSGLSSRVITNSSTYGGTTNYSKTSIPSGTSITLTAPSVSGYSLSWSGCNSTSGNDCTVSMTATKTVTVTYSATASSYSLTVNSIGASSVGISSTPAGAYNGFTNYIRTGIAGNAQAIMTAPATAPNGYVFSNWSGCSSVSGTTCTRDMLNANRTVTVTYVLPYTLTVNSSGLSSRVITNSSTYGGTTNYSKTSIPSGTSITLTAPSVSGYSLSWSGCNSTSGNDCTVSMTASKTVTVTYSVSVSPTGSISASPNPCTISSGSQCTSTISWTFSNTNNAQIYVRSSGDPFASPSASPGSKDATWITDAGYWFDLRTNSSSNANGTLLDSVFVEGNYPTTYTLTTSVSPAGSGSITSNPAGINCPSGACIANFSSGLVTLTATQVGGYSFSSWTGACLGQTSVCTISMDAAKSTTANFSAVPPPTNLAVACNIPANGQVTVSWSGSAPGYYFRADNTQDSPDAFTCWSYTANSVCTAPGVVVSPSYTFSPTSGANYSTWVHACSDASCSSYSNAISATFNCSLPLPTLTLTASPTSIMSGTASTLTWSSITNADSCTASGGAWSGVKAIGGGSESTGNLSSTQTYTLTCVGPGGSIARSATVTVTPSSYTLTAEIKSGSGTVTSVPAGIDCPGDCSQSYSTGSSVTLTADPANGYKFDDWGPGGPCNKSTNPICSNIVMNINQTAKANFSSSPEVSVSCSVTHSTPALIGQTVVWTATASGGVGALTYAWSGTNISSPSPTTNPFSKVYSTIGEKTANVTVTDSVGTVGTCALPLPTVYVYFDPSFEEF